MRRQAAFAERLANLRYSKRHSEQTRRSIIDAAAIKFRENGFSGVGVDAIASQAQVTTGAIYNQFQSKDRLFAEVVEEGLQRLVAGLEHIKEEGSEDWVAQFASYYLSKNHVASVGIGCCLPTLSFDVARADEQSKLVFTEGLEKVVGVISEEHGTPQKAMLIIASLLGSVVLARATGNGKLRDDLLQEILNSLDPR